MTKDSNWEKHTGILKWVWSESYSVSGVFHLHLFLQITLASKLFFSVVKFQSPVKPRLASKLVCSEGWSYPPVPLASTSQVLELQCAPIYLPPLFLFYHVNQTHQIPAGTILIFITSIHFVSVEVKGQLGEVGSHLGWHPAPLPAELLLSPLLGQKVLDCLTEIAFVLTRNIENTVFS